MDHRLKIIFASVIGYMFLMIVAVLFYFASRLPIEMNKTMRALEFAAFQGSASTNNKEKINCICGVKNRIGFTCFDWFELDMNNALKVRKL